MTTDDDKTPVREMLPIANLDEGAAAKPEAPAAPSDDAPTAEVAAPVAESEPAEQPAPAEPPRVVTLPAGDDGDRVWKVGERALVSLSSARFAGQVVTLLELTSNAVHGGLWMAELEGSVERATVVGSMLSEAPPPPPPSLVDEATAHELPSSGARGDGELSSAEPGTTAPHPLEQIEVPLHVRGPAYPDPMDAIEIEADARARQLAEDNAALAEVAEHAPAEASGAPSLGGPLTERGQVKQLGRVIKRV